MAEPFLRGRTDPSNIFINAVVPRRVVGPGGYKLGYECALEEMFVVGVVLILVKLVLHTLFYNDCNYIFIISS